MEGLLFLFSYCYTQGRNKNNNEAGVVLRKHSGKKSGLFIPFTLDILHF